MRHGVFPAISVNKDVTAIPPLQSNQKGDQYVPFCSHSVVATPYGEHGGEKQGLAPDSQDVYERNDFSELGSCIFPYTEKH